MKRTLALFFLVIMTLNVTFPLVEQLQGVDLCEFAEVGSDNTDEENSPEKEKEKEKEKESIAFSDYNDLSFDAFNIEKFRKSLFPTDDFPISELYKLLPELPPEA